MRQLKFLLMVVLAVTPMIVCAASSDSSKLHMFIEHGAFYALNGEHVLDVDLTTGVINVSNGANTSLKAKLARQAGKATRLDNKRILWIGSVDVVDGQAGPLDSSSVKDHVQDIQKLGGSWLLTYEYQKWANGTVGHNQKASACNSQLGDLVKAVLNVQRQCQAGGGPGCDGALEELDDAFSSCLL